MDAQEGFIATTAIYEGLVKYKSGSTDVEPSLAEKWDVSSDGMQYTFHLKPEIQVTEKSPPMCLVHAGDDKGMTSASSTVAWPREDRSLTARRGPSDGQGPH